MVSVRPTLPPLPVLHMMGRLRDSLVVAQRRSVPAPVALLEILQGGFLAQVLCTAAELGVADVLAEGPMPIETLASRVDADPDALARLLRPLVAEGIFAHTGDVYRMTGLAQPLRSDGPVSMRSAARFFGSSKHREWWSRLAESVRTGSTMADRVLGMPFFDFLARDRQFGELFDSSMTSFSELALEPTLTAYDFSPYRTIVDVAGGRGRLLTAILQHTPTAEGILFDLPEVVEPVPAVLARDGLADRCRVEAGSFFDSVPAGADAYILKHIVHDWPDAEVARILANIRSAMSDTARLLVIELVLPDDNRRHFGNLLDLEMLLGTGGRERTEQGYRDLFRANGLELVRRVETTTPDNILEVRRI
ncbi:methyltransferase [Nocardia stercoris]|uniref:Hydroxyneurosporene methyltransferase n=1 Tax=Nocardia stercoris TaxID=2483361 RepID=A0A3M2KYR4_9NOCA|nr:methyltransferase [Nocardia stercoris]RMI30629.1 hydroxyneurosporene methyltransferase [Nocardia stercoris]